MPSNATDPSAHAAAEAYSWTLPRFTVFLLVAVGILFWDVLLGIQTFVFRDYGLFGYPLASYNRDTILSGSLPLWNPLSNSGIPYLGQWNTMVLYPLSIIYLVFPLTWSLPIFCLGHLCLGGCGMFVLTQRWTLSSTAAAVAGIAYALNGLMLNSLMWPNNIAALGLLPWVIWSLELAAVRGGRSIFIAALIGGTQMLSGAPEVILFTWALAAPLAIVAAFRESPPRFAALVRIAAVVGLVAGLAMAQLLPFLELLRHSQRTAGVVGYESAMPGWGWANYLVPAFHTYRSTAGVNFQAGQVWTSSYYLPIAATAIAWLALLARQPRTWFLAVAALICAILALGNSGGLYPWLRNNFPGVAIMNFPVKFTVPVTFAIPALAALAIAGLLRPPAGFNRKRALTISGIVAGCLIAGLAYMAFSAPLEKDEWPFVGLNALARAAAVALGLWLIYRLVVSDPSRAFWTSVAFLSLLIVDVAAHLPWQNPTVAPAAYERSLQEIRELEPLPKVGASRVMLTGRAINEFRFAMKPSAFTTYIGHRLGFYDNCNLIEHIPKLDGFYSLYVAEEGHVRGGLYATTNTSLPLLSFLGVSHFSNPSNITEFLPRDSFLPWVTIGQGVAYRQPTNLLSAIFSTNFLPQTEVFLDLASSNRVGSRTAVQATIQTSEWSADGLSVRYDSPSATMLTIAQTWYPNWQSTVDGNPAPILRANYAFQAIPVPAGNHTVEIRYVDQPFRRGATISFCCLALCVGGLFWRRRTPSQAP